MLFHSPVSLALAPALALTGHRPLYVLLWLAGLELDGDNVGV